MSQRFVKGLTNNHLTWVMVDATDAFTPESALSAATKIKIYGKLRGATGVNFVSSGTGSLTADIQHVGASALGIYTIALAKADLSDASAAWYDQYIISLSATGAAYQTLVVDGGIIESQLLALSDAVSNAYSAAVVGSSRALLAQSYASDAYSAAMILQSRLSDFDSRLVSDVSDILSVVRGNSDAVSKLRSFLVIMSGVQSDVYSALVVIDDFLDTEVAQINSRVLLTQSYASDAASAAAQTNSRVLLVLSNVSDVQSDLNDVHSALIGLAGSTASATANASTLELDGINHADQFNGQFVRILSGSQIGEVRLIVDTDLTNSRITVKPAFLSAVASGVDVVIFGGNPYQSAIYSDVLSTLTSQFAVTSNYLSNISALTSDVYSAVAVGNSRLVVIDDLIDTEVAQINSRVLLTQSAASDAASGVTVLLARVPSTLISHINSMLVAGTFTLGASNLSDVGSAVWGQKYTAHSAASTFGSLMSDIYSRAGGAVTASDISDIASAVWATALGTKLVQLNTSDLSDLRSAIIAGPAATITASDISDIASAVWATALATKLVQLNTSDLSDLRSAISAGPTGATASAIADKVWSDFGSKVGATPSQMYSVILLTGSTVSDVQSYLVGMSGMLSDTYSAVVAGGTASDVASKVWSEKYTAASNVHASTFGSALRLNMSRVSDVQSYLVNMSGVLSDTYSAVSVGNSRLVVIDDYIDTEIATANSRLVVIDDFLDTEVAQLNSRVLSLSGVLSDTYSLLQAGVEIGASSLSDLRSAMTATELDASDLSDIASAVWATTRTEPVAVVSPTGTMKAGVEWLVALSRNKITQTATLQTVRNDADLAAIASAAVSDDGATFIRNEFGN